jgi:hypothetical protein
MISSSLKPATGTTFSALRAMAIGVAFIFLGVLLGAPPGSLDAAKAQNQPRTYTKSDVERFIKDVEESSKDFQRDFDIWLDQSSLNGQQREDRYNKLVKNLTSSLGNLRSNFNRRNDWWLSRNDMQRVLNDATRVNLAMRDPEVRGRLNRQWGALRRNIDRLAVAFNLPPVGSNYTGPQPIPQPGNNYRNCTTGVYRGFTNTGEAELAIAGNGVATARSLVTNAVYNGRCANDVLYFDWGSFNIVREGRNNISTVEIGNPTNRTQYRRVGGDTGIIPPSYPNYPNNPGYPGNPDNGNGNIVPNWAVGTFRGMTNNAESELTLTEDGVATIRALNANQIYKGSYANGVLTFAWGSFRLVREGDGFRTVDVNNQQNRTSYRRVN